MPEKNDVLMRTRTELGKLIRESENATWNVSEEVGLWLRDQIISRQAKNILEVGTSIGYSALFLAEGARATGGKVTTIESHEGRRTEAQKTFTMAEVADVVTLIPGHAPEIFATLQGPWDFIFFDATKYEHLTYIQAIEHQLSPNALLVTDNATSHAEALAPFRTYMEQKTDVVTVCLPLGTGLLVSDYSSPSLA